MSRFITSQRSTSLGAVPLRTAVLASLVFALFGVGVEAEIFDLRPGPDGSTPRSLTVGGDFDQHLFFFADDGTHGEELWHWDGDRNEVLRLSDLTPGILTGARGGGIQTIGNRALFLGVTDEDGFAIYAATVGQPGIVRVATDGEPFGYENSGLAVDTVVRTRGRIVFRRPSGGVYVTDGTLDGTSVLLTDARVYEPSIELQRAAIVGARVILVGEDRRLWSLDPVSGASEELLGADQRIEFTIDSKQQLISAGTFAIFRVEGVEGFWVTDGTAEGTRGLADPEGETFTELVEVLDGQAILARSDVAGPEFGVPREIWSSRGTPDETELIGEIEAISSPSFSGPVLTEARMVDDRLVVLEETYGDGFVMDLRLWTYHADSGWQQIFHGEYQGQFVSRPASGNRSLLFVQQDVFGCLLATDGTLSGTRCVAEAYDRAPFRQDVQLGDRLLFTFEGQGFVADGRAGTSVPLVTVDGRQLHDPEFSAADVFDRTVFFRARDDRGNTGFWQSDGTALGTRAVTIDVPGSPSFDPREITLADNRYFFSANTPVGRELVSEPRAQVTVPRMALQAEDRVDIVVRWTKPDGETGFGSPTRLTEDSGHLFFFRDSNLELMIKVLDGRTINGHFWVFYGSLSNVAFTIEVTDRKTGLEKVYTNPQGDFASVGDIEALPASPDAAPAAVAEASNGPASPIEVLSSLLGAPVGLGGGDAKMGDCAGATEALCLQQSRFRIEAIWEKPNGEAGTATALPLTTDTGAFYFFRDSNLELLVKVLDGRDANGHFWVFYGALSNVRYEMTVTDTETGVVRTYVNPQGDFASVGDTRAFAVP